MKVTLPPEKSALLEKDSFCLQSKKLQCQVYLMCIAVHKEFNFRQSSRIYLKVVPTLYSDFVSKQGRPLFGQQLFFQEKG
jgi:hypothetical protein